MTPVEFNQCVDQHSDALYRYCLGLTQNEMNAEDLVQISFTRLWESRKDLPQKAAKNWLYRTAYRAMIDDYRKMKRNTEYRNQQIEEFTEPQKNVEFRDLMDQALSVLSPEHRNLVLLRDYEGYSYLELSDLTGMSMSNVKVTLFRCRKAMKDKLLEMNFTGFKREEK